MTGEPVRKHEARQWGERERLVAMTEDTEAGVRRRDKESRSVFRAELKTSR